MVSYVNLIFMRIFSIRPLIYLARITIYMRLYALRHPTAIRIDSSEISMQAVTKTISRATRHMRQIAKKAALFGCTYLYIFTLCGVLRCIYRERDADRNGRVYTMLLQDDAFSRSATDRRQRQFSTFIICTFLTRWKCSRFNFSINISARVIKRAKTRQLSYI